METVSVSIFLLIASGKKNGYDFETSFIDKNESTLFLFSGAVKCISEDLCTNVRCLEGGISGSNCYGVKALTSQPHCYFPSPPCPGVPLLSPLSDKTVSQLSPSERTLIDALVFDRQFFL